MSNQDDEALFFRRNHDPRKYEGRIDPAATSESLRLRYNRGRYWIITSEPDEVEDKPLSKTPRRNPLDP